MLIRSLILLLILTTMTQVSLAQTLVYDGTTPEKPGKHLVFLAGDHEYRSEESLPAMARILAKHHGFKCTVLFSVDQKTGEIAPGSSFMPGMDALDEADLMVIFLRFQDFPAEQMQPIVDYLDRAGPVVGMRTSTHAFKIPEDSEFARFDFRSKDPDFKDGFGRQILGETWAGHYGKNHVMSTRLDLIPAQKSHPILRGVEHPWVHAGGYWTEPTSDSVVLANAQPLQGMTPDSPPAEGKLPCPGVWTRTYSNAEGKTGRVFTTTYGASEDLLDQDFRRLMINACFWASGEDDRIKPDLNIEFVGPYNPTTFKFNGHRREVLPSDLAGWESSIMPITKPISE